MRAAKLDWMQRQKEAFRNRQQVSHLALTCVDLPRFRSVAAVCDGRPSGTGSGLYLAKSCTCRVQRMASAPWKTLPPWLAQQRLQSLAASSQECTQLPCVLLSAAPAALTRPCS